MGNRLHPDVAAAFMRENGFEPLEAYAGVDAKWLCRCRGCGSERRVRYRAVKQDAGCAVCNGNARIDDVVAERYMLDSGLRPRVPYPGAGKAWESDCLRCQKVTSPTLSYVRKSEIGCKFCAKATKYDSETAVAIMRDRGLEPLTDYPGARTGWKSRCTTCRKTVTPHFSSVKNRDVGCNHCARMARRLDPQEAANLMIEAGWEPLIPYPGSSTPWQCACSRCGVVRTPTYASVKGGSGCGSCSGVGPLEPGEAIARMEVEGLRPLDPYPGSASHWRCECRGCGRVVSPRLNQITQGHGGCGYCAGNKRFTDDEASTLLQGAGFEPLVPYPGSSKPWRSTCRACNVQVAPSLNSIRSRGTGCRACAGQHVDPTAADQLMREHGLEPLSPYPGSAKPWPSRCLGCETVVSPNYSAVRRGQGGCMPCRISLDVPGRSMGLYLMVHEGFGAVKVGIGVVKAQWFPRVQAHEQRGWVMHAQWSGFADHRVLAGVERRVLRCWAADGLRGFVAAGEMPQGGWTETAPLARVNLDDLVGEVVVGISEVAESLMQADNLGAPGDGGVGVVGSGA